jgi:hypothetical protein
VQWLFQTDNQPDDLCLLDFEDDETIMIETSATATAAV